MNKLSKRPAVVYLLITAFFSIFIGCTKENYDFDKLASNQWNPEFAIAIVNGSMGITDFNITSGDSYLQIAKDSSMSMVVNGSITTFNTKDFIPGFTSKKDTFNRSLSLFEQTQLAQIPVTTPPQSFSIVDSQKIDITPEGATINIDSIKLKSGTISVNVVNGFNIPCNIAITFPSVKDASGKPIVDIINLQPLETKVVTNDIASKMIDLTDGGTTYSSFKAVYTVTFTKTQQLVTGKFTFYTQIVNLTNPTAFSILYGNVKNQPFFNTQQSSIPLDIFKVPQTTGTLKLNDAIIKLMFKNSFGIPIGFVINQVKGLDGNKNPFYLNAPGISPSPFIIKNASLGTTYTDSLTLNKTNPVTAGTLLSLPDFLSKLPTSFIPQFSANSNPGAVGKNYNFITDTSKGSVDAQITIPLDFNIKNFAITDTFDYQFSDIPNIESATLRIYFNNGLPVEVGAKLIFVDKSYKPIYTIDAATIPVLTAAVINPATGRVIAKTPSTTDIVLDNTFIANANKIAKVIFQGKISSPSGGTQSCKIYSGYTVDIKMGAKAKIKN